MPADFPFVGFVCVEMIVVTDPRRKSLHETEMHVDFALVRFVFVWTVFVVMVVVTYPCLKRKKRKHVSIFSWL